MSLSQTLEISDQFIAIQLERQGPLIKKIKVEQK